VPYIQYESRDIVMQRCICGKWTEAQLCVACSSDIGWEWRHRVPVDAYIDMEPFEDTDESE
jgi:hypothetical protein